MSKNRVVFPRTMVHLVQASEWYDQALQSALQEAGWPTISRSQSLLLANLALGVTRASRLARCLGVTQQSLSKLLADLVDRNILTVSQDPEDSRARVVGFTVESLPFRRAAAQVMRKIDAELIRRIGEEHAAQLMAALNVDWGDVPVIKATRAPSCN